MKLLLFILGLTLCASWPIFDRNLADFFEENNEENGFAENGEYHDNADDTDKSIGDIFDVTFHLNEEGEVELRLEEENAEAPINEEAETPTAISVEENTEVVIVPSEENTETVIEDPAENTEESNEESPVEEAPEDLLTQVRTDSEANDVFTFGANAVINQGFKDNKIPKDNYTVTAISNYSKNGSANGNLYHFSCVATNANGSSVINITFTAYYQFSSQRKTLSSWSYNIQTTTVTPTNPVTDYVQIGADEISTATVQQVLNFGVSQIYNIGSQAGKIPVSNYTVKSVVSVWKQVTSNGANYRCQVVLVNSNQVTVNANFTVAYQSANQQTALNQYEYTVTNINSNTTNINSNTNNNNNTTTPTNTTTNNTTNTTNTNTTNPYIDLTQEEIKNSNEVQGVLAYGINQTLQNGYTKNRIPVSNYAITKIVSVARQAISNGRNAYKCSVELQDPRGVSVKAQFVIFVKTSNQDMFLSTWAYQVSNIPNTNTSTNTTNTTTTTNTTNTNNSTNTNTTNNGGNTSNNTTQPTNNTTTNNSTQPTNNNTNTNTNTTTNTTQPATNNTTPVKNTTNTTSDGYVELEESEIETSGEVQGALEYGTDQIIQSGNAKGKIPVSNYTITKVSSVEKRAQNNGRNSYRCDVELQDAKKVLIHAQFVVNVKVSTQEFSIGTWTYNISNIRNNNPSSSTNTTNPTNTTNNSTSIKNNTNTNNSTNNGGNNATQPTNNTNIKNNTTGNANSTNTTTNTNATNTNNTVQPTANTTTPANTTNSTASNYTALSQAEINSTEVQGALNYGANQILLYGYTKGQIPVSNYTLSKVNSVGKQAISNGRNAYQCNIELLGVNKVVVKAQFVVNVKVATQERFVTTWAYQTQNLPSKPSNTTNNSTNTKTL